MARSLAKRFRLRRGLVRCCVCCKAGLTVIRSRNKVTLSVD